MKTKKILTVTFHKKCKMIAAKFIPNFIGINVALSLLAIGANEVVAIAIPYIVTSLIFGLSFLLFDVSDENLYKINSRFIWGIYSILLFWGFLALCKVCTWFFFNPKNDDIKKYQNYYV